jgi:transcriptional regulator with XRE-family HTH domain
MNIAELGSRFREARLDRGLTQRDVAERAGLHPTTVSDFERGVLRELGLNKSIALLDAVGLELVARPRGHVRTLDDIAQERHAATTTVPGPIRKRVRR